MYMKRLKSGIAVFVAAVMSMAMLTACGGGGGGGTSGVTPVAPVTPSAFSSTKTYQLAQSGKGKSLYTEYWSAETNDAGEWMDYRDEFFVKQGSLNGNAYADCYMENNLYVTMIENNGKEYGVFYYDKERGGVYNQYVEIATMGGAEVPEGKNIYLDLKKLGMLWGDGTSDNVSGEVGGTDVSDELDQIQESKVTASTGTYTMPGTSQTYYAEIFTSKVDPMSSVTYAYDKNDELKAIVSADPDGVTALFFNKFEFDSSMFKASKLNVTSYNAVDITEAYIAGMKKMMQQ